MFKTVQPKPMEEAIQARAYANKFGTKRIVAVSDNPDPKQAGEETYKTRDVFQKNGGKWDKYDKVWYWNSQFVDEEKLLKQVNDAVRQANIVLGIGSSQTPVIGKTSEIPTYDDAVKAKEYLVMIKGTLESVKSGAGKVTFEILNQYINGLADKLEDSKLLEDIAAFTAASKQFTLETGMYSYSLRNDFLIWLQMDKGAREFGSAPYWYGRGYKPKENAHKIYIVSGAGQSLDKTIAAINYRYPNAAGEYMKLINKPIVNPKYPIPRERKYAFWKWAMSNGYGIRSKSSFEEVPIYDNLNVEPIQGKEQIQAPKSPPWYNSGTTEDERAEVIINALEEYAKENGIKIQQADTLGGAQGTSSGDHIKLLTNSPTVGLLSTLVHELTHSLAHNEPKVDDSGKTVGAVGLFYDKTANKGSELGDMFGGRIYDKRTKELHADSVAYTVLTAYGFPVEHSVNYLALWKADRSGLEKYQKLIRDISMHIIKIIEKYANKQLGSIEPQADVEASDVQPQGSEPLQESINRIKSIISKTNII
jgi:hypothetical protein